MMVFLLLLAVKIAGPSDYSAEDKCRAALAGTARGFAIYTPCKAAVEHQRARFHAATDEYEKRSAEYAVALLSQYVAIGAHQAGRNKEALAIRAEARTLLKDLEINGYDQHMKDNAATAESCYYVDPRGPQC